MPETASTVDDVLFRERLTPPAWWWALALLLGVTAAAAVGAYLGPGWGLVVLGIFLGSAVVVLGGAAVLVTVSDTELRVGRARIEHRYLGSSRALDADATRGRAGPAADARAFLVLRPYVATSVEVSLDDPGDPAPYWLVASRRPEELVAALARTGSSANASG